MLFADDFETGSLIVLEASEASLSTKKRERKTGTETVKNSVLNHQLHGRSLSSRAPADPQMTQSG
jgi:hypothetical protein